MCWLSKLFKTEKPKPKIELLAMPSEQALDEIKQAGLRLLYPALMDHFQPYYYTTAEDWADVMDYIYFKFPMPPYIVARMDCEDFAILLKGLISAFFGLNYQAFVLGWADVGRGYPEYHGWNYLRSDNGFVQWEPQTKPSFGFIDPDDEAYRPEYALL